ncbi:MULTISPECIES: sensor histidine kinase [Streptomyces]|uniref:sensor histidine kinase n=1 Tax=Streptomyces TaxID=1883 RepID=UPI00109E3F07|nr:MULTISPECIES: sensor histidine kinase [Streptomyces]THA80995.1 sensor histidine kinase [Streptomyces sp. LRa12]WTC51301.1 sensor histidine kinase [Streptomyces anthocyanicus]GHA34797.1 two-component sensor histidine kinase [Streptomyces anthocyanicus]
MTGTRGRLRRMSCRLDAWQLARQSDPAGPAGAAAGGQPERMGPPPTGFTLLPWLLMGLGSLANIFQGNSANPWIGGLGLFVFNSLYIYVAFRSFDKELRESPSTRLALAAMALVTCGLALAYGGSWLLFFPLLGLAAGAALRGRWLGRWGWSLAVVAGAVAGVKDGWTGLNIAYGTFLSTMVTAAILSLSDAVRQLRAAREELATRAVAEERLRFSRDLHDLLGHTLSVIVVKSEAARRLAPRDLDAALTQITDIESVGRQALTEVREAVTGYREGSLGTELDRARSALSAADVDPVVRRSGPPLPPQAEALLGWVVREAVTNVVRHSGASRCEIAVAGSADRVRLTVTDDGTGAVLSPQGPGTGLTGLRERLAAAGGSLTAGVAPRGGFSVTAELPVPAEGEPVGAPA